MSRRVRRILTWSVWLFAPPAALALAALGLASCQPSFYRPEPFTPEQLEAAAKRVENKLVEIRNIAAERQQDSVGGGGPTRSAEQYTVSFTEDELNAFFLKWSELQDLKTRYEQYLREPRIVLAPGRVILAGRASAGGLTGVVSLSIAPSLSGQGQLRLASGGWSIGRLPVPWALLERCGWRAAVPLEQQLPGWRRAARVDSRGGANESAVKAAYGQLLLAALAGEPAPAVLLVPVDGRRAMAFRLTGVEVQAGEITFRGQPLLPGEHAAFVEAIKSSAGSR